MTETARQEAARTTINIGRATEALHAALHHLHAAMTVTPLGQTATASIGEVATRTAVLLRRHQDAITDLLSRQEQP